MAQSAIDASDARFVPMLVVALKMIAEEGSRHPDFIQMAVSGVLAQLPEDFRK
jgi:hypothetical protein